MRAEDFSRIALALPETVAPAQMDHPDFRVGGRIFATPGDPDAGHGMVKLDPEQQERRMHLYPKAFSPAAGAWRRRGSTVVLLKAVAPTVAGQVLAAARRLTAPKKPAAQLASDSGE